MFTSFTHLFTWTLMVQLCLAFHAGVFKTCDESGFCFRNRQLAANIKQDVEFQSPYTIDATSIQIPNKNDNVVVTANVVKKLPNKETRVFPLELSLLEGNNIRIKIDEIRHGSPKSKYVNPKRYDETPKWAFASQDLPYKTVGDADVTVSEKSVTIAYGDGYVAELTLQPVTLTIFHHHQPQVVMNQQQLLNMEHLRLESDDEDDHLWENEVSFNMFHDLFKPAAKDTLPFGPESMAVDFTFVGFEHVYGIPEHADSLDLKDTTNNAMPYRLFNVDIFEYETQSSMPMYGLIPLMVATKPSLSIGVFWINSADTFVDIDKSSKDTRTHWMSENGVLDVMIFVGEKPDDINKSYGLITGYVGLPQLFALGYHQCRWNYNDEQDVLAIDALMDEHHIPYDTIWLDIEYADEKKYFTWQGDKFSDPERMLKKLDHTGRNLVVIIDPHFKTGYFVSEELQQSRLTIMDPQNSTFVDKCWPGESLWIDTHNPLAQKYWDEKHQLSNDNAFLGKLQQNIHLWNDMSEPSVFEGPETTSPKDNLHYGGWEHRSVHNNFGLSYHEATFESLTKRLQNTRRQRPFILTRSYFSGSQRTAAMWSGDNQASWDFLKASVPMMLTSNVVGMPFAGSDVGGFFGDPLNELLTRWYQTGIFYPFFRAHAHIDTKRREPWVPGDPYTSIIRQALQLRYSLLPVFYTSFYDSSTSGRPVIRPMFYESPENTDGYAIDDQFFLGDSGILVKPVTDEKSSVKVYLPDTRRYFRYTSGRLGGGSVQLKKPGFVQVDAQLGDIPMFLRAGSIVPKKDRYRRSSRLMERDPYTLVMALDDNGAVGRLYIDDGTSYDYKNGEYAEIELNSDGKKITASVGGSASYARSLTNKVESIVVLGATHEPSVVKVTQNGVVSEKKVKKEDGYFVVHPGVEIGSDWLVDLSEVVHDEL